MLPPSLRLLIRLPIILIFLVLLVPPQVISHIFRLPTRRYIPVLTYRLALKIASIKVRTHGPRPKRGTLILSNHVSWLDILLIGSVMPVNFVAKADIAHWPLFGMLAKIGRTIFIEREKRSDAMNQRNALQKRLSEGERVVLFPEGSTSDGTIVLPFKSALISAAETKIKGQTVSVQPMTIVFSELCGLPMGRRMRVEYAWIGHLNLVPHMLKVLCGDPMTVDLIFFPETNIDAEGGRKALAGRARRQVQDGLAAYTVGHSTGDYQMHKPCPEAKKSVNPHHE
ncbi:MAG: lysophospholipid acyltransferase family protein [Parvibaculales bacterium]